jgi:hypothetical protein
LRGADAAQHTGVDRRVVETLAQQIDHLGHGGAGVGHLVGHFFSMFCHLQLYTAAVVVIERDQR